MFRLKELDLKELNTLFDDVERRIVKLESSQPNLVSGYTMTFVEKTGKFTLTKGDVIVTITKDS